MDLFDVGRSCARRWYVFVPLMLIVGWISYTVYSGVKPTYYASVAIGFAPPSVLPPDVGEVRRNGLVDAGGAPLIANLLAIGLRDPAVVQQVVAAGGLPVYTSKVMELPPPIGQLPLVMVEVTNPDPAAVTKTLELVAAQGDVTLRTLQRNAGVPEDRMVALFPVQAPSVPVAGMPSRVRSTGAIFIAGTGFAVVAAVLVDLVVVRRRERKRLRAERAAESDGAGPHPPGSDGRVGMTVRGADSGG
ncbi:hypothetical protein GCM10023094_01160 [Rhodococcus olei]|uniref:Capsular polysaccharide biosynthesis protein n=1 Tax=Rhodococcus olei TaxID=2161675 RepID=A0ABP8NTN2_9NOCA